MKSRGFFQAVADGQAEAAAVGALGPDVRDVGFVEGPEGVEDVAGLLGLVPCRTQIVDDVALEQAGVFMEADDAGLGRQGSR